MYNTKEKSQIFRRSKSVGLFYSVEGLCESRIKPHCEILTTLILAAHRFSLRLDGFTVTAQKISKRKNGK